MPSELILNIFKQTLNFVCFIYAHFTIMATFLFDKIIFGPIHSRRLGLSLGVNLLNPASKHCNFDCIYCECGWNGDHPGGHFNSLNAVISRLETTLKSMETLPDVITFAGNGEPTMHPDFDQIIDRTIELRDRLAPQCKIAVLSNATMIDRQNVREALQKVDSNILKLDSAIDSTVNLINQPNRLRPTDQTIELMKMFDGNLIIQTMFLRGSYNGVQFDNTTPEQVDAWLKALAEIRPRQVMLYSIDRDTPAQNLEIVSKEQMEQIAEKVQQIGIEAIVS